MELDGISTSAHGFEEKQTKDSSGLKQAQAAYKEYKERHRRFEAGDPGVFSTDVDASYREYLRIHNSGAGEEGYLPNLPYEKSFARRPEPERAAWLSEISKKARLEPTEPVKPPESKPR